MGKKDKSKFNKRKISVILLLFIVVISLLYLTVLAHKYTHYPSSVGEIKVLDSSPQKIKVVPVDRGGKRFEHNDKNVFRILE